jgi:hypothetical protein
MKNTFLSTKAFQTRIQKNKLNFVDLKWNSVKIFFWFLNFYFFYLIVLIKTFFKLWISFIYSFDILNINNYFKQYNFLYSLDNSSFLDNPLKLSKALFNFSFKSNLSYLNRFLQQKSLAISVRLDTLNYYPKFLNANNFQVYYKKHFRRLKSKKWKASLKYHKKSLNDRVWNIWKLYGGGKWKKFNKWNSKDRRIKKYISDNPIFPYLNPLSGRYFQQKKTKFDALKKFKK